MVHVDAAPTQTVVSVQGYSHPPCTLEVLGSISGPDRFRQPLCAPQPLEFATAPSSQSRSQWPKRPPMGEVVLREQA